MGETVTVMGYFINPDAMRMRKWRQENPERSRENDRNWAKNNPKKVLRKAKKHRDSHKEQLRNHERMTRLYVKGKRIRIKKRPYPASQRCELCNRIKKRLGYHHWDDDRPELGMWICIRCHHFVETLEEFGSKLVEKYFKLKEKIENG